MASVVDSIRSVYQESFSLFKMGGFSFVVFIIVSAFLNSSSLNIVSLLVVLVVVYLYLGFASIIINNRINQRIQTLPSMDVINFFNVATKAFSIAFPYLAIGYFIANIMVHIFSFEGVPQLVAIWIIRFFMFSLMGIVLINFSEKFDIKDALNFSKITNGLTDVIAYTMVCFIVLFILGVFTFAPLLFLIHNFYQFGPLFQYVSVCYVTMCVAILADYWGQLHYEIESKNNFY